MAANALGVQDTIDGAGGDDGLLAGVVEVGLWTADSSTLLATVEWSAVEGTRIAGSSKEGCRKKGQERQVSSYKDA